MILLKLVEMQSISTSAPFPTSIKPNFAGGKICSFILHSASAAKRDLPSPDNAKRYFGEGGPRQRWMRGNLELLPTRSNLPSQITLRVIRWRRPKSRIFTAAEMTGLPSPSRLRRATSPMRRGSTAWSAKYGFH